MKPHVLIVEDVENQRESLSDILSEEGYNVFTAADGASALRTIGEQLIDVAIVDIKLPDISGEKLISRLKEINPDIETIIITGFASIETAISAVEAGVSSYLTKPLDMGRLLTELKRSVEHRRLVLENSRLLQETSRAKEKWEATFNSMTDIVFVMDKERKILLANRATCNFFGRDTASITGANACRLVHGKDVPLENCPFNSCLKTGLPASIELKDLVKELSLFVSVYPICSGKDKEDFEDNFIHIIRDVTQLRQAQRELIRSQKMESVGVLAAGIAHDFKNILASTLGYASLLEEVVQKGSKQKQYLTIIKESIIRAKKLTNRLLTFSRKSHFESNPIDLNKLITGITEMLRETKEHRISLCLGLSEDLDAVRGDSGQIEQVITNLLINAADAISGNGKILIHTENFYAAEPFVSAHPDIKPGAYILLSVTDTGTGIPVEISENIFDPFFTTKDPSVNSGLGLAVSYNIVKNHSGVIEFESSSHGGTSFKIYLPALDRKMLRESTEIKVPPRGTETILIIEDEIELQGLYKEILNHLGYKTIFAKDGLEALQVYAEKKRIIALVILDLIMPKMSGAAAFEGLKSANPDLKVIISSGYLEKEQAAEVLTKSTQGFVEKPFSIYDLAVEVRRVLDLR
ncbi:MAG: response regulator [Candidatus Aureabacteria bacterium]|nr:response regulator [Candidatus Auribacterota bacterium]